MEKEESETDEDEIDKYKKERDLIKDKIFNISKKSNNYCEMYDKISDDCVYEMDSSNFSKDIGFPIFLRFYKNDNYVTLYCSFELNESQREKIKGFNGNIQDAFFLELLNFTQQDGIYPEIMLNDKPPYLIIGWTRIYFQDFSEGYYFTKIQQISMWGEIVVNHLKKYFNIQLNDKRSFTNRFINRDEIEEN